MILDWHNFDAVFQQKPDYALDQKTVENILRHRREFGDELFFDRIWKSIGLTQPSRKNYPARSNQDLRNVWSKIVQSPAPDEQKLALLYYVLLDCRGITGVDNVFVRRTYLPQKYQLLVQGLWELDHSQFSKALEHLTDPSLALPFADEVLLSLLKHPRCEPALATAFYITVSPPLRDPKTVDAYFDLLSSNNLPEAYYFAKRQDKLNHKSLFEKLVATVHQEKGGQLRATRATILVGLPFSSEEDAWFEDFLLRGKGTKFPGAKDTVMVRRLATGKSVSAVTENTMLNRLKGENIDGVSWETIRRSIAEAAPS
ncbi:hypothetical protein LTR84_007727 [Exophiala bonariae]|uniref:ELYS-like domain-containing protein n=1 Tax=Exophiala bonariae TaxID=1690606 RepID=A0AAV9NPY7_9EURO|nr:hypothetical protein LTR84_007727 [Exophiala bonariae]